MSKRLKEIKDVHKRHNWFGGYLSINDIDWLIEQAERVPVLEKQYGTRLDKFLKVDEENKRYREGIKKLYLSICKGGKYDKIINKQVAFNIIMDIERIDENLRIELDRALEGDFNEGD